LASINPSEVVIEFPEFWQGNSISMAATIKGDLFKLTYQIGGLAHLVSDFGINTPIFIEPRIWKAQLPKSVVVKRLDALGLNVTAWKLSSHQADAIGMGISAQGCL
jgi:hypothetical protein